MKKLFALLMLVAASFCITPAFADHHANVADVWIMHVKAGQSDVFESAFKKHLRYRKEQGDTRDWKTWLPVVGKDLGHYVIRSCCVSYAQLDEYAAWSEGSKVSDHWSKNVDRYIDRYEHYLHSIDFGNSHWPDEAGTPAMVGVTELHIKVGHEADWNAAKASLSKHAKEGNWPRHWLWTSQIGGGNVEGMASWLDNFAAMQPSDPSFAAFLAKQMGSGQAAKDLLADYSSHVKYTEYTVYRHNAGMSMNLGN